MNLWKITFISLIVIFSTNACNDSTTTFVTPTPTPINTIINPSGSGPQDTEVTKIVTLASTIVNKHWDVHLSSSPSLASLGPGIAYSRILRFRSGPDVPTPNSLTECDICESWEYKDPVTYVFHIKNNVFWHDIYPVNGRRLIAGDIVFSLERQKEPGNPNALLLNSIKTIEAKSDNTVEITLTSPDSDFLINLANGLTKIVAPEVVSLNNNIKSGPVIGTGPWILEGTRNELGYFFKSNDKYHETGIPGLDRLEIITIQDEQTMVAAFLTNKVDLIESPMERFTEIKKIRTGVSYLTYKETGRGIEFALNTSTYPLNDLAVRRAVFQALDPWDAINNVWGGLGFVSSGLTVLEPSWILPEEQLRLYLADEEKARETLQSLNIKSPVSFEITVADYGDRYLEYGDYLKEQLSNAGFQITTTVINPTDYPEEIWYKGNYQAFLGPIAPVSTPNMYLFSVIHSKGKWNTHKYQNLSLDLLIEKQLRLQNQRQRKDIVHEIQRDLLYNGVRFMPFTRVATWVWWPNVKNFYPNMTANEYFHLARLTTGSGADVNLK